MCNVLTQIIMPSVLGHFPMFYAFFFNKVQSTILVSKLSENNTKFYVPKKLTDVSLMQQKLLSMVTRN
jgi:hypothetical protein